MCLFRYLQKLQKYEEIKLNINGYEINALVADSSIKRILGLMYREDNASMFFVFDKDSKYGIWMLNMKFPLDIVWLDKNMKIIDFIEGIKPCMSLFNCKTYTPEYPSRYVLELKKGSIKKFKINKNIKIKRIKN